MRHFMIRIHFAVVLMGQKWAIAVKCDFFYFVSCESTSEGGNEGERATEWDFSCKCFAEDRSKNLLYKIIVDKTEERKI